MPSRSSRIRRFGITRVKDGDQFVGTMSGGERQALAIGRAMYFGAKVLILDEPTSALGVKEAAIVLKQIRRASADGAAVVFITHNAHHAIAAGDRFVILDSWRSGRLVSARAEVARGDHQPHGGRGAGVRA